MRIKGNRHGTSRSRRSALPETLQDELVTKVDPIEIANAHHRRPEARGDFAEVVEDLHVRSRTQCAAHRRRAACLGAVRGWCPRDAHRGTYGGSKRVEPAFGSQIRWLAPGWHDSGEASCAAHR